jgi:hypothetical protein
MNYLEKMAHELWLNHFNCQLITNDLSSELAYKSAIISVELAISLVYSVDHQNKAVYNEETKYWDYEQCKELKDLLLVKHILNQKL